MIAILFTLLLPLHNRETAEIKLFNMVNEYRVKHGKTRLMYCDSLSYIAEAHSVDLLENFSIDNRACFLHSWSPSNRWTGGCIPDRGQQDWSIMYNKPNELLGMKVKGYEIAVINDPKDYPMSPEAAMEAWINSPGHRNVILEIGWKRPFKRMGVSIYKGVSTIWFAQQ